MRAYQCDRCGALFEMPESPVSNAIVVAFTFLYHSGTISEGAERHLCEDCGKPVVQAIQNPDTQK